MRFARVRDSFRVRQRDLRKSRVVVSYCMVEDEQPCANGFCIHLSVKSTAFSGQQRETDTNLSRNCVILLTRSEVMVSSEVVLLLPGPREDELLSYLGGGVLSPWKRNSKLKISHWSQVLG